MAKKLVFSGIMVALNIIFLYLSCIIPTNTIFLFCFSTFFIAVVVAECGVKMGIASVFAAALLSLFMLPNKILAFCFALFFSFYPLLKYFIEKLNKRVLEWAIKIISAAFAVFYLISAGSLLFANEIIISVPVPLFFGGALAVFVVYDVALSLAITFYKNKISQRIKL